MLDAGLYPYHSSASIDSFDQHLESSGKDAKEKLQAAVETIQKVEFSHWFGHLLEDTIVPQLTRIGFDESIQWAIFRMSAPAWESMNPVDNGDLWFHPTIINNISEIRKGFVSKEKRKSEALVIMEKSDPYARCFIVKENMDPVNIFSTFDDISTSWIILPRVYTFLERTDADYLIGYVKSFIREKEQTFLKILVRIIIEFVGNFTIKFLNEIHPRKKMVEALFYGYAALFYKTLRNPPDGLENLLIFRNFFYWANRCLHLCNDPSQNMIITTGHMKKAMEDVFPIFNVFGLTNLSIGSIDKLLIALRHGDPGIKTVVKYFSPAPAIIRDMTNGRIPYVYLPSIIRKFTQAIQNNFEKETLKTQGFIEVFLSKLKKAYDLTRIRNHFSGTSIPDELRFARARVQRMIQGLVKSRES